MNFQLIQDVVAYCEEYEKKQELHFRYTITTNGTIWNEEVEEFFRKNQFTVQISIYGKRKFIIVIAVTQVEKAVLMLWKQIQEV